MRRKFLSWVFWGLFALTISPSFMARSQESHFEPKANEWVIRSLMSDWVAAYKNLDAKRLAALEVPNVEIVDRFGELHQPTGRKENESLWSDTFDVISRSTEPPKTTIDHIRFLSPDVAVVQMSWQFASGILLTDGSRIPPYSQIDIYVVTKSQSKWLVAAHYMQERKP
jgi:uncharacterized protein (TIGR02246 family)